MPTPRQRLGVAVLNDTLYSIGGYQIDSDAYVNKNERYTPVGYIPEFPSWIILPLLLTVALAATLYRKRLTKPPVR